MNSEPGLVSVYKADSGLHDHQPRCCTTAKAITTCADLDALQDLIRQSRDAPD